jgi:hypothetical protein
MRRNLREAELRASQFLSSSARLGLPGKRSRNWWIFWSRELFSWQGETGSRLEKIPKWPKRGLASEELPVGERPLEKAAVLPQLRLQQRRLDPAPPFLPSLLWPPPACSTLFSVLVTAALNAQTFSSSPQLRLVQPAQREGGEGFGVMALSLLPSNSRCGREPSTSRVPLHESLIRDAPPEA